MHAKYYTHYNTLWKLTHTELKTYPHPHSHTHRQTHTHKMNARNNTPDTQSSREYSTQSSLIHILCNSLFFRFSFHTQPSAGDFLVEMKIPVSCGGLWLVLLCRISWVEQITLCFSNMLSFVSFA